jgi:hypothetical protein
MTVDLAPTDKNLNVIGNISSMNNISHYHVSKIERCAHRVPSYKLRVLYSSNHACGGSKKYQKLSEK